MLLLRVNQSPMILNADNFEQNGCLPCTSVSFHNRCGSLNFIERWLYSHSMSRNASVFKNPRRMKPLFSITVLSFIQQHFFTNVNLGDSYFFVILHNEKFRE